MKNMFYLLLYGYGEIKDSLIFKNKKIYGKIFWKTYFLMGILVKSKSQF